MAVLYSFTLRSFDRRNNIGTILALICRRNIFY